VYLKRPQAPPAPMVAGLGFRVSVRVRLVGVTVGTTIHTGGPTAVAVPEIFDIDTFHRINEYINVEVTFWFNSLIFKLTRLILAAAFVLSPPSTPVVRGAVVAQAFPARARALAGPGLVPPLPHGQPEWMVG